MLNAVFCGSLDSFDIAVREFGVTPTTRVCVLATAAAFRGAEAAVEQIRDLLAASAAPVQAVAAINRASADDASVVSAVANADLVVLVEGAPLHARSVWRHSALGEALATAALLCVGSTGSVLGETMIDPRGGAPTTGLGLFTGVVVSVPASAEQSQRTHGLVAKELLVELGLRSVVAYDGRWRVVSGDDLLVTRAGVPANLPD